MNCGYVSPGTSPDGLVVRADVPPKVTPGSSSAPTNRPEPISGGAHERWFMCSTATMTLARDA